MLIKSTNWSIVLMYWWRYILQGWVAVGCLGLVLIGSKGAYHSTWFIECNAKPWIIFIFMLHSIHDFFILLMSIHGQRCTHIHISCASTAVTISTTIAAIKISHDAYNIFIFVSANLDGTTLDLNSIDCDDVISNQLFGCTIRVGIAMTF